VLSLLFATKPTTAIKKFATIIAMTSLAVSGFAQGTVIFQNAIGTAIKIPTYDGGGLITGSNNAVAGALPAVPGGFSTGGVLDVGLVWGTSAAQLSTITGGTLAGVVPIGTAAGQIAGSTVFGIPGTSPNNVDFIAIYMWDSSYGNTLVGALACETAGGWFGSAAAGAGNTIYGELGTPLSFTLGPTPGPAQPIFGTTAGFYGKTVLLTQSPEPATVALGGLGAAALLIRRRRK
jgi:hypothetical protein